MEKLPMQDNYNEKTADSTSYPVIAIFYAILGKNKVQGWVTSGVYFDNDSENKLYEFKLPRRALAENPWLHGAVYILNKDDFKQWHDDEGNVGVEWAAEQEVKPICKIEVGPDDFRFINEIKSND